MFTLILGMIIRLVLALLAKGAITLRDLTFVRYWFIEEIVIGEDSEEASNDTTVNINTNALKTKDMRANL